MERNFYNLEGSNIYFRRLSLTDAPAIHMLLRDPAVTRFTSWPRQDSPAAAEAHIKELLMKQGAGSHCYAAVVLKSCDSVIGIMIMFNIVQASKQAEIGYVLAQQYWGQGYGTEMVMLTSEHAISQGFHRLYARVIAANTASARVLEKNGFQLEGRLRQHSLVDGEFHDELIYGKLRTE